MKLKEFCNKYRHAWVFLYAFIYLPWFFYLEQHVTTDFHMIYSKLDDYIPFVEYFILPYTVWFAFVSVTMGYFFFTNKKDFYRLTIFLFSGMTIFLIISSVYPNGQSLRPDVFLRDNIFVDMVKTLYKADTPTNILPSIHVYNSIGVAISIFHSEKLKKVPWVRIGTAILTLLIILSTVFLKQHSIIDIFTAIIMAAALYPIAYKTKLLDNVKK